MLELLSFLKQPEFYAVLIALLAALRGIGELFEALGKFIEGKDFFERTAPWIKKVVAGLGKVLNYFGIGNKQRK